jgi:replicative DNA helicase
MTDVKDFGYLGNDFQLKLVAQVLCDRKFGLNIIQTLNPKYFENQNCKQLISLIRDYNQKYDNALPTLSGLKETILAEVKDDIQKQSLVEILKDLDKKSLEDDQSTQDLALKFCKQQEIVKAVVKIESIIKKGDFENYDLIEDIIRKALTVADKADDSIDVDEDLEAALADDYRKPIPTGIDGIDVEIGGGLGKGELAAFLAPLGVGKSTFLTKLANTAYGMGYNVLQMFFEDPKKAIQRKHAACNTGIALNELSKHIDICKDAAKEKRKNGGKLILKKCPSDSTTVQHIKQYLRYLQNRGIKLDMLIIDYLDCLVAGKNADDVTASESLIMRQLETIADEFQLAIWVAIQTNRSGISAEVVTTDQVQGSIKRAQVAHLIISAAKSNEQKVANMANMSILKSRFGGDGKVFKDMTFRNDIIYFDTATSSLVSQLAYDQERDEQLEYKKTKSAVDALKLVQDRKNKNKTQLGDDSN